MQLRCWRGELKLRHHWEIARGGGSRFTVMFVELRDRDGVTGIGETAPSRRYHETIESVEAFFAKIDPAQLDFSDQEGSRAYLNRVSAGQLSAKGALDMALLDGAGKKAGKPVYDLLGLGFQEGRHTTSFSIGIDSPERIREKVLEAADYPILKLKVGVPGDREILRALRGAAPQKRVRVDANEGWHSKEQALAMLEWLAEDGNIEFCEQPMPAQAAAKDLEWLRARSPLPLMADESCITMDDIPHCAEFFHCANVKLVKAGGISGALDALQAARKAGLKTMIGCMIESSILISAGAQLAELADYLDLDGNLLISNDPFTGPTAEKGALSFRAAVEKAGLRVTPRSIPAMMPDQLEEFAPGAGIVAERAQH